MNVDEENTRNQHAVNDNGDRQKCTSGNVAGWESIAHRSSRRHAWRGRGRSPDENEILQKFFA